ncbi:MAG: SDR family oxidoreductase [Burkholderiaceae bacterium]|nr:SDR family oxidoreductase [Burkholderiaceae bacterium]MDO9089373.1 SDR family oxidoreductase [Burkholderiaceae bacterium]
MDLGLTGKWALVCGASKGLGFGCAQALVREGANVLIVARGVEALNAAAARLLADKARPAATEVVHIAADITTVQGRAAVFAQRRDFDILVTNAGGPPPGDFRNWDRDIWIKALDANMLTPIELIKATVDGMAARGFGRVVNITSNSVKAPIDILGLSNGARTGLTGFVAGVARNPRLAGAGVTINNLLPGSFATDRLMATIRATAEAGGVTFEQSSGTRLKGIPAGRYGTPEEFGAICAFLCSVHAAYINGQNLLADGGTYPGTL